MIKFEKLPSDILSRVDHVKPLVAQDRRIVFAYLFGGLARRESRPMSDVDLAVYLNNTEKLAEYKMELFSRLADLLGTGEVDLVVLNTAPVSITGRILQNRKVLIDKDPFLRHCFESLSLREFFDFKVMEETFFLRRYGLGG